MMIVKTFFYVCAGYVLVCLTVFLLQRKLLYYPDRSVILPEHAARYRLQHWPSEDNFKGLIRIDERENPKGTILVFHGNAGNALDRYFYADALERLNMRVILAEYPGYGGRTGRPSESVLVNDALDMIKLVREQFEGPLMLWGESLGCGVISSAVSQTDDPIQALILMLPWDSLANVAQTHYPFLPAKWLVRDRYDSITNLKTFKGKAAVLLAGQDEIIPVRHGRALYESIRRDKRLWVFDHAGHNTVPIGPDLSWWKEVVDFVTRSDKG